MARHRTDTINKVGITWAAYLDSIRWRYPYTLPPAIVKVHPFITVAGQKIRISSGSYHGPSARVLKRRKSRKNRGK
jgi:hypothetical protein